MPVTITETNSYKVADMAEKQNRSLAQTILSWIVQQNISVIPKTVQESRMVEYSTSNSYPIRI